MNKFSKNRIIFTITTIQGIKLIWWCWFSTESFLHSFAKLYCKTTRQHELSQKAGSALEWYIYCKNLLHHYWHPLWHSNTNKKNSMNYTVKICDKVKQIIEFTSKWQSILVIWDELSSVLTMRTGPPVQDQ